MAKRRKRYQLNWWTRERTLDGLRLFYRTFRVAPVNYAKYHRIKMEFGCKGDSNGVNNPFPSKQGIYSHFTSLADAWMAAGVDVIKRNVSWTAEEDAVIRQMAGAISQKEIGKILHRSASAVQNRAFILGVKTTDQGWYANRIVRATGISLPILEGYIDRGKLPCLKGSHNTYIDPADLLVIKQIDWNAVPDELADAVRKSLMKRLVCILSGQDWRVGRVYRFYPRRTIPIKPVKRKRSYKLRYAELVSKGICPRCLNKNPGKYSYCPRCRESMARYAKQKRRPQLGLPQESDPPACKEKNDENSST